MNTWSNTKLYLTGSRLEAYLSCPKKYYFANIRNLHKSFDKKSPQLVFDQVLHKVLNSLYRFHIKGTPFDFAKLQKSLDYFWNNSEFETVEIGEEYKKQALDCLKSYYETFCKFEDNHIETDYYFKTNLLGIEYGGKFDRVDKNEDGSLEIIDYKTGKMPINGAEELEESLNVQMLFMAGNSIFNSPVKRLTFIFLKEKKVLYVYPDKDKIETALSKFKEIVQSILDGKFLPNPSNACCWCDFKDNCPEGQKNTLSIAKLRSFLECPKKYSFKYIEKKSVCNNSTKSPLLFYSYINSMIFNLYKGRKQYSTKKLMEHTDKTLNTHEELDETTRVALLNDCQTAFEYINKVIDTKGFVNSISLKTELKTNYDSILLSANIDRLDVLSNGKYQPVIYKTGRQSSDYNSLCNDLTTALYWIVANNLYPDQIDSISFVYLLAGQTVDVVPSEIAINRLKDCISKFVEEKTFEGKQGSLCSWCDYYDPCPMWKIKPHQVVNESIEQFKQRIRLSYSKMSLYLNCPFAYKKLYIDRVPPKPKPFFDFGVTIHETFEQIYDPNNKIIEKPTLEDIINLYEKIRLCHRDGFSNSQIEEEYRKDGIRQITLYYNHFMKNKVFKKAAAVEKYFEIPCGKYAVMTGSIDRIDALDDGTFEILDYKTEPTLRPQEEVDKDKQLSIYYWAAKETLGYNISKLSLLMLDNDLKMKTTRQESDIPVVLESIDKTAYEMLHETNFIPKKNKYCKSCDHLEQCPLKDEILADDELKSMQKFSDEVIDLDV